MSRLIVRAAAAALCALSLSGCVDSDGPILTDAEPLFGKDVRLQFYHCARVSRTSPNRHRSSGTVNDTSMPAVE